MVSGVDWVDHYCVGLDHCELFMNSVIKNFIAQDIKNIRFLLSDMKSWTKLERGRRDSHLPLLEIGFLIMKLRKCLARISKRVKKI